MSRNKRKNPARARNERRLNGLADPFTPQYRKDELKGLKDYIKQEVVPSLTEIMQMEALGHCGPLAAARELLGVIQDIKCYVYDMEAVE